MKEWVKHFGFATIIFILGLGVAISVLNQNNHKEKPVVDMKKPIHYEILDDSVKLPKGVQEWMKENVKKEGFYTKKNNKETFVLISGGTKPTTGYGISLLSVEERTNGINVTYEIISPNKNDKVEKKETNPHMILRLETKGKEVVGHKANTTTKTTVTKNQK